MGREERERPEDPVQITFAEAANYMAWLRFRTHKSFQLPTLDQLRAEFEAGEIVMRQREWTMEGFIYDPETGEVIEKPKENELAGFRIVRKGDYE